MIKKKFFQVALIFASLLVISCASKPSNATQSQEKEPETSKKEAQDPPNVKFAKELQVLLEKGDNQGAIAHFENLPKSLSDDIDLKLLLGALHYSEKNYDMAIQIGNEILEKDSENMDALELISLSEHAKGDKSAYNSTAQKILEEDPNNSAVNIQKAEDYARNKKWKLARQTYAKALKGDPENEDAMFGYAQMSFYTEDLDVSQKYFEKLLEKNPQNAAALAYMGKIYSDQENYLRALGYIEQAVKLESQNYDYWMDYGSCLRHLGKFDDAAKAWTKATEIDPNYFLAYAYLAGSYDDLGKFDLALENYHKVIETNPKYFYAYESAAILEYHQKNYAEAIRLFDKAYSYSDSWSYALMIAGCYYKMNNPQAAKKVVATQLKKMNKDTNEYAMVRFFGDNYSRNAESQLNQKITKETDRNKRGKMLFYMGFFCEINKADELAKDYYAKVTKMQAPMFFEYRLAEWGLAE